MHAPGDFKVGGREHSLILESLIQTPNFSKTKALENVFKQMNKKKAGREYNSRIFDVE